MSRVRSQVDRNTGQGSKRHFLNMPIVQGMKLATKERGRAEVEFEDGSTVRITPRSTIEFSELSAAGFGRARFDRDPRSREWRTSTTPAKGKADEFTVLFAE